MTTLVCQTLYSELSQNVTFSHPDRLHVGCVSPYLLMVNSPAGTFTLEFTGTNGLVFSKSFTSLDVKASIGTTDNYAHVFLPIIPDNPVQIESGEFTIKITSTGYTASSGSFIGWIQQYENEQNELDYVPADDAQKSFSIRFKSFKEGIN